MEARGDVDVALADSSGKKRTHESEPRDGGGGGKRACTSGAGHGNDGSSEENKIEPMEEEQDEREQTEEERLFLKACEYGDEWTVRRLLDCGHVDVEARCKEERVFKGETALIRAARNGKAQIVELLIAHGAEVNATEPERNTTALHWARGHVVTKMLLEASAHPNPIDWKGKTPLHWYVQYGYEEKVALLLDHGAAVDVLSKQGHTPLATLVCQLEVPQSPDKINAYRSIAQALVSHGAKWDDVCDNLVEKCGITLQLSFRVAVLWWMDELARGIEDLTDIPEEVFRIGASSVEQYLAAIYASNKILLRRKICVVGPSFWGKTSLVKSISMGKPVLEHAEDRTIGIDQFALSFCEKALSDEEVLMAACEVGDTAAVRWLLDSKLVDLRAARTGASAAKEEEGYRGETPLVLAIRANNLDIVEALLTAGADPNVVDRDGTSPLVWALYRGFSITTRLLLQSGAQVNSADEDGETPLHCCVRCPEVTSTLLEAGADVHAVDILGMTPFDYVADAVGRKLDGGINDKELSSLLEAARSMVSYGANCDEIIGDDDGKAPAFREAVRVWKEERERSTEMTSFPADVLSRDPSGVREYAVENAHRQAHSRPITHDSQSSLETPQPYQTLGSNGKSRGDSSPLDFAQANSDSESLGTSSLESLDFNTDAKPPKSLEKLDVCRYHEVTFWDFAGQEAYQVAHSPFFTKRTLYLVCVDLHAYAVALEHTEIRADNESGSQHLMDEFVDSKILRWIRLILARQPDAEFVFVGTKADVLMRTSHRIMNAHKDLLNRVNVFAEIIEGKLLDSNKRFGRRFQGVASSSTSRANDNPFSHVLGANVKRLRQMKWLVVNCKDLESIQTARKAIEQIIIKSKRSFQMPTLYSQVLDVVLKRRRQLHQKQSSNQVKLTFKTTADVLSLLRCELTEQEINLPDAASQAILRTFHDIGDVMWFEDLGIEYFKDTVILHPLLLIDFVRQIVHHNHNTEVMTHAALKELPYWDDLDPQLMLVMKQLLQQFHLVHPAGSEMKWNSDLIVPAYWRSRESALWLFGGDLLMNDPSLNDMEKDFCVQWEYHFTTALPDALFDELVIESYMSQYDRQAGPDWILYKVDDQFACRVVVTRASRTLQRVLRVEAIASKDAGDPEWGHFEHVCESLERVMSRYNGLIVSRFIVDDKGTGRELEDFALEWIRTPAKRRRQTRWLPPSLQWYCDSVMKKPNTDA